MSENLYERVREIGERLQQAVADALNDNPRVQRVIDELENLGGSAAIDVVVQPPSYKVHAEGLIRQFKEVRELESLLRLEDRRKT